MQNQPTEYVILGNGVAGTNAAKNIRKKDPLSGIKIFSQDCYPFYSRPRLPEFLAGEVAAEDILVYNYEWYEKNNIRLYLNCTVKNVDPKNQKITLADKSVFTYGKLLFATGSSCVLPPIEGIQTTDGVFTLRTIDDVSTIIKRAKGAKAATIIGGGLLGLEAGNGLRKTGLSVTVIELFDRLLPRQLDTDGASILQKQLEGMGFKFFLGVKSDLIKNDGNGETVNLNNGTVVKSDIILVSAGIKPNTALAQSIAVTVNKGIVVNDFMETNLPNIYAAGDVAEHKGRIYGIWPASQRQGVVAGINMAGGKEAYTGTVPANSLKVAGIHLTSAGDVFTDDKTVEQIIVKNTDTYVYKKLLIKEGRIIGAIFLGDTKNVQEICQLLEKKADVSSFKKKLLEPDFDIEKFVNMP